MKHLGERACAEEIRNRLAQLRADDAALWGKMSAGEMVCHLREAFRMAVGAKNGRAGEDAAAAEGIEVGGAFCADALA